MHFRNMSYLFIINPKSGLKLNRYIEKKIREKFSKTGYQFSIEYTAYKKHAKKITLEYINKGYNNIIAVGGDGTIKEIAEVIINKKDINLGIIPQGSGNGLARNLGIPLNIDDSIDLILKGNIRKIDCGIVNGDIFLSTCGMGVDAYIAYLFNNTIHSRGLFFYFIYGILGYFRYKPVRTEVIIEGKSYVFYPLVIAVANGKQYGGGAIINPQSMIDDGFFELVVIEDVGFFKAAFNFNYLFNSKINHLDFVKYFRSSNFTIILPPASYYHLDGEDYKTDSPLNITILPGVLPVIC